MKSTVHSVVMYIKILASSKHYEIGYFIFTLHLIEKNHIKLHANIHTFEQSYYITHIHSMKQPYTVNSLTIFVLYNVN